MQLKETITLIKYVIKPVRLVDVYYFLKENKRWKFNNSKVGIRSYTSGSCIGASCVIGCDNKVINSNIGRHSNIKSFCSIYNATVGAFCVFAQNVTVGAGRHPVHFASTNFLFYSNTKFHLKQTKLTRFI